MIRIAISQVAFDVARTLALGPVSFENKITENGDRLIWLKPRVVERPAISTKGAAQVGGGPCRQLTSPPTSWPR
jgi:hypothetical protein